MKLNIKIPTSLNEITLRQYKRFLSVQKQTEESLLLNAKMIEIFCSVDLPNVMRLKVSDIDEITEKITNLFETKPQLVKKFKINKIEYGFHTNLDELSLGEYIDLDMHIGDWDNMEKAMNVLYRPILVSLKDKYSIEEYTVNDSDKVLDMPMDAVLSSVFFFVEFRSRIVASYDELFGKSGGESNLDSISQFSTKYGWCQSLFSGLAQGDIRRLEDITQLNVHTCLYALEYMKEKSELEAKQIKKNFK